MKRLVFSIIMLLSVSLLAAAADKVADKPADKAADKEGKAGGAMEKTFLVKTTDRAEKISFELMSAADFKQLETQLALEAKLNVKAMAATEKAWREDENTKKKSFPRSAIVPRTATKMAEFTDEKKASDALAREEKKQSDHLASEKERADKKAKDAAAKKKPQEQADREKKRDAEREAIIFEARNLYETKLQELMAPAEAGAADPAKEEPKGKEKEADKKAK